MGTAQTTDGDTHPAALAPPAWAATLPQTKFVPPRPRPEHLSRDRQLAQVDPGARVLLVAAPAGYGKSTFVAQWLARDAQRASAWVQLEAEDDGVFAFWIAIANALARVDARIGQRSLGALAGPVADVTGGVLGPLIDDIGSVDAPLGLVLDDFHLIDDEVCHVTLGWLIEHAPDNLRIAIATRSEPALPLGRLRVSGALSELRTEDLRFDADEVDAFLNGQLGIGLARSAADALAARTEGWPAGLYLAALSLRGVEDPAAFAAAFAGDDRVIVDYLVPEILAGLDPELRSFLLRTSILERFCAPLCDALSDDAPTSERTLAELERSNLFLVPLDRRRGWFRYHHLFRDLLRAELQSSDPAVVNDLHRRAAAWHREESNIFEAIGHEMAAGELERAATDLAAHWPELYGSSRWPTVAAWMAKLPEERVADVRGYIVFKTWLAGAIGTRDEVARLSALARAVDDGLPLPDGSTSTESSLALIDAIYIYGDVGRARAAALRAAELERSQRHAVMVPICLSYTGFWTPIDEGDVRAAFGSAIQIGLARDSDLFVVAPGFAHLAFLDLLEGKLVRARANVERAMEITRRGGVTERPAACIMRTAEGWLLLAEDRPDEAEIVLVRALEMARVFGEPLHLGNALRILAECRHALGDEVRSARALAEARAIVEACHDPGLLRTLVEQSAARVLTTPRGQPEDAEPLSERERDVLRLLSGTLALPAIGRELHVSHNTVKTHCKAIYRKLAVRGRAAAVARARELGLR